MLELCPFRWDGAGHTLHASELCAMSGHQRLMLDIGRHAHLDGRSAGQGGSNGRHLCWDGRAQGAGCMLCASKLDVVGGDTRQRWCTRLGVAVHM